MTASRPATAAMIMIVRGLWTNQARLDTPMTDTEAWTLLRGAHSLDYRRLAAHRLFDLAIAAKDSVALDLVVTALEVELSHVCCHGLLRRIASQQVCHGWRKWARTQLGASTQPIPVDLAA